MASVHVRRFRGRTVSMAQIAASALQLPASTLLMVAADTAEVVFK